MEFSANPLSIFAIANTSYTASFGFHAELIKTGSLLISVNPV